MQRVHARLDDSADGEDEEEQDEGEEAYPRSGSDRSSGRMDEALLGDQLLPESGRSNDDERDRNEDDGGNEDQSSDMEQQQLDSKDDSSFWDTDDENLTGLVPSPLPRTQQDHSIIDVLTDELLQREIPAYMDEFEVVIPDAEIVVGSVPLEEVQQREHAVEEAKLRQAEIENDLYQQREMHLAKQEEYARSRLLSEAKRQRDEVAKKNLQFAEVMQLRTRRLGYMFQQAENHLKDELKRQQARVAQVYGDLAHSRVPQSRKRYRVEWQRSP